MGKTVDVPTRRVLWLPHSIQHSNDSRVTCLQDEQLRLLGPPYSLVENWPAIRTQQKSAMIFVGITASFVDLLSVCPTKAHSSGSLPEKLQLRNTNQENKTLQFTQCTL